MKPTKVQLQPNTDYYYCTCAKSKDQLFCDGSHNGTDFAPLKFTVDEEKEYYLCPCKKSDNAPFCDGSHAK